jgi:outer membrane protein TolC
MALLRNARLALVAYGALGVLVGVAAPTTARAQDAYVVPDELRRRPELPEGLDASGARALTLSEAIQIAVQQNLGVVLSREQYASTDDLIGVARGEFEPTIVGSYLHGSTNSPPPITLLANGDKAYQLKTINDNWNLAINERFETGTQLSVGMTNVRTLITNTPLTYNANLGAQLTQPLLRSFSFDLDVPRADILRARFASVRARDDVKIAMLATVHATDDAYWDLVAAFKNYEVVRQSLKLADEQVELTRRHIDAGVLATSDMISAESTQAQRQLALLQAEATIGSSADALRYVLALPRETWAQPLLPTDAPQFAERIVNLGSAVETAERSRPEIAQRRLDVEAAGLEVKVAKNGRLPELDAVLGYGLVGQESVYTSTLNQLFSGAVPAWSAGLNLTWAPLMVGSRAQVASLRATEAARRTRLQQVNLDLFSQLRDDLRTLSLGARQVRAAAKFRDLARQALEAEERKFLNGTSSNFVVAQRQADLASAQQAELAALISHRKATTALDADMGVLLDERGIRLDAPPR